MKRYYLLVVFVLVGVWLVLNLKVKCIPRGATKGCHVTLAS